MESIKVPDLKRLDTECWRRTLAGLQDPDCSTESRSGEYREAFISWCIVLCELFGDSLDRTTLWDRISSGIAAACSKVVDGDLDRFCTECLNHVRADMGACSRSESLAEWVSRQTDRDIAWRQGFIRHVSNRVPILIVHGRAAWQQRKAVK